ncbi:MAG: PA14 domain-containing protein [Bacteroidota bacterium]
MNKIIRDYLCVLLLFVATASFSQLKSLVYDFDGADVGQTDLPEGDYGFGDLTYQTVASPLPFNDMISDRVLKINLNWSANYGVFGRGISRFIEFNQQQDVLNFYFYNPASNNQNATLTVALADDDNQSNAFENSSDDQWVKNVVIPMASGWQLISVPLKDFTDGNAGGNGVFDMAFTQNKGMLVFAEFRFTKNTSGLSNPAFYMDFINFSEGELPHGATILDLPPKNATDYARLGAFESYPFGEEYKIPQHFESLFPSDSAKKIKYVNWFMGWSKDGGTVANNLPGAEVQTLINNGYTPIITWEPMFAGHDRLSSVQPRLNDIIGSNYNAYIDNFANKLKSYNDTVIVRFMHEFEGNWYPWSIVHNGNDPNRYVAAYRKVVDRFRALGATKVKWMWCVNSDYYPYQSFNWIVPAYPGDNYVDIIATDIYNNHYPEALPWWRSFRWQTTETYYYLNKYFPNKPLYICEVGCRERKSVENPASETKGAWFERMDKELHSNFSKVRALIFFNAAPDQNWFVNSSPSALQSLTTNVWRDNYYFGVSAPPPPPPPTATCSASGSILREVWNNVSGVAVSNIPVNTSPSASGFITSFEAPPNVADNYGQRIRGYVCPPVTGNYIFWIASDDNSELWLSTNDQPTSKVKIASVVGWTFSNEFTKYASQQSVSKYLVAGQKYYIEALHKEGSQGDNLSVGWQLPSGSLERPIPGSRLSPFSSPLSVSIISPSNNSSFTSGSNISIDAAVSGATVAIQKVEFFSGASKLGEDLTSPYSYNWNSVTTGTYALNAKVTDTNSNTAVSSTINITVSNAEVSCPGNGTIARELWNNVSGSSVSNIPLNINPNSSSQITSFQTPVNFGDNYGQRLRGYVCPPTTGNYTFWIASDDNSELWLSTNDQPSSKVRIAYVAGTTLVNEWTKYSTQQSTVKYLVAGQKYYIEALHKESTGADHLEVGWQLPNATLERPIPGNRLLPYTSAVCAASIQANSSITFCSGGNVTLTSSTGPNYSYQWIKDNTNISGATNQTYNTFSSGNYQVRISYPGCTAWSAPTKVTVNSTLVSQITPGGSTTFCAGGSVTLFGNTCNGYVYQWIKDGVNISGATSSSYLATASGSYQLKIIQGSSVQWSAKVKVTANNCGKLALPDSAFTDQKIVEDNFKMNVFPNPTTGLFTFDFGMDEIGDAIMEITVVDAVSGKNVYNLPPERVNGRVKKNMELPNNLVTGVYILQIQIGEKVESIKLILSR